MIKTQLIMIKNTTYNDKNTTDDSISAMNDRRWDINIPLPKIHLKSKTNAIFLNDDGCYIEETKEHLCGHFIINISVFPKVNMFGHYLTIFFNRDEKNLVIFNSCENENYGEYGEIPLEKMKDKFFNGSCF